MTFNELKVNQIVRGKQHGREFEGDIWALRYNPIYQQLEAYIATENGFFEFRFDSKGQPLGGNIEIINLEKGG